MPTQYTGRVVLILAVLVTSLWAIFPSGNLRKPNLKPGIDMVGGASLLYEIRPPTEGGYTDDLANRMMESLKKRVDPDGVRNLVWRPQGNSRLEIQMPVSGDSGESAAIRAAYAEAQAKLESTNVRPSDVIRAVENLKGDARRDRLNVLAMGSEVRGELFGALASVHDQVEQASADRNIPLQAEKEMEYEALRGRIGETNLTTSELETVMEMKAESRGKRLDELKREYGDFPGRVSAIDAFAEAYLRYDTVRGTLDDATDLKRLLRGSGMLGFYILVEDYSTPEAQAMEQRLAEKGPMPQPNDTMRWFEIDRIQDFQPYPAREYNEKFYALVYSTEDLSMVKGKGAPWDLVGARVAQTELGSSAVGFQFDKVGGRQFGRLTGNNLGRPLVVTLDDKIISAANINSAIYDSGIITRGGGYSQADLRYLINTLNAGSLPAQLTEDPISERVIGPQLGRDNLVRGLAACIFGLVVVAFFLIGYYYVAGIVAMVAVLMNMAIILGVMAMLDATFTLPSVAGIVLTIGMAVDANVLIFERLREEQNRGLSIRMALRNAYDRAFSAILDSNVTTGITSMILYYFGSEEVKGFGLTLMIGLASSMFTALFVTKTIFGIQIDKFGLQRLSSFPLTFPKWDRALRPDINWMSKAKYAIAGSAVFIIVGLACFVIKFQEGEMLDIEFAKGTSVQFELKEPTGIEAVRGWFGGKELEASLPSPSIVSVGLDKRVYEIITPNDDANAVRDAVVATVGERLQSDPQATFTGVGKPLVEVLDDVVLAIDDSAQTLAGMAVDSIDEHRGGVAIVLRDLQPALKPSEIKRRLDNQRLHVQSGSSWGSYRSIDVESETGADEPTTTAIVLASDPHMAGRAGDETEWRSTLAGPVWELVNEAINRPAQLQRVNNFDAQVAGETRQDAMIAIVLSLIVTMGYIWARFGNFKFGTATVIALTHDALFTLAAIGVAHYLADTAVGRALLLEPFRINLTMMAALLTVIGFSMNDTVVIFDRIRENRGKFGVVSRSIVNNSINQTLSRTLLTGGTTIVTILVMYIWGGSGIHGFTFALLVGIVVGTYSSIAIAAPILLLGGRESLEESPQNQPVGQVQRVGQTN